MHGDVLESRRDQSLCSHNEALPVASVARVSASTWRQGYKERSPGDYGCFPPQVLSFQTGDQESTLGEGDFGLGVDVFISMGDVWKELWGAITDEKPNANDACHRNQNDANR